MTSVTCTGSLKIVLGAVMLISFCSASIQNEMEFSGEKNDDMLKRLVLGNLCPVTFHWIIHLNISRAI